MMNNLFIGILWSGAFLLFFSQTILAQDISQSISKSKSTVSHGIRISGDFGFVSQNQGNIPWSWGYEAGLFLRSSGRKYQIQLELNYFHKTYNLGYKDDYTNVISYFSEKVKTNGISLPILIRINKIGFKNLDLFFGPEFSYWIQYPTGSNGGSGPFLEGLAGLNYSLSKHIGLDFRYSTFLTYLVKDVIVYEYLITPGPIYGLGQAQITSPKDNSFQSLSLGLNYKF